MDNPDPIHEDSDDVMGGPTKPGIPDRTSPYVPDMATRSADELILEGKALKYAEVPVPARLGKYEILEQIGRGGMGIVWKGFDPDLRRTVAIKVLSPHLAQSEVARRRFQREARAAAAISHDNVLTIHSVEEQNQTPFLVMEYVSGQSLKEYVSQRGKLDALETIRLSAQIAQGLAAAHVQGVIHRDVKMGNVMLHEGATRVRLTDFGLARVAFENSDLTSHDHAVGTPAYMAPEQIRGGEIDARADLFSLGCVMYSMLTGHSPFHGRTHAETIHKIMEFVPARLHDVDPAIPPVLSEMIEKLLQKDPDQRYQSAFEVAESLCRLLAQINQTPTAELAALLNKAPDVPAAAPVKPARPVMTAPLTLASLVAVVIIAGLSVRWFWPNTRPAPSLGAENGQLDPTGAANGVPAAERLTRIVVGPGPDATCATLSEAVRRAARNCTITVIGPGPFEESVVMAGADLNGLKLKADSRATWRCPPGKDGETPALMVKDVAGVSIEGIDFEVGTPHGRGLSVTGSVGEITVTNCRFRHLLPEHKLSLATVASRSDSPGSLVRFRQCQFFAGGGPIMCLSIRREREQEREPSGCTGVECLQCQFTGPNTLVYVAPACGRLRFAENVFVGGENAINLSLKTWEPDSRIEIVNNTFAGTRYWLGLMDSFRNGSVPADLAGSRVCNNLILGGERVQGGNDQWEAACSTWQFAANWWEPDATTKATSQWKTDWNRRVAEFQSALAIPERTDLTRPDFLVPAADSPLLTAGIGGDLPTYIGARRAQP